MKFKCNIYLATLYQLSVALFLLWLTRFAFYFYNADVTGTLSAGRLAAVALAGLQFDIVAVAYANALFIVMRFLPLGFVMERWWRRASMVVYGVANSALLLVNIGDIVFFRFNNSHMQFDTFRSFLSVDMVGVALSYFTQYWWAFLAIALIVGVLLLLATRVRIEGMARGIWPRVGLFLLAAGLTFIGMRGTIAGRPIGIDRAGAVVDEPAEINVVLNTPFCIMRSANYSRGMETRVFFSDDELAAIRSSVQQPACPLAADSLRRAVSGKNIMLIILESGGQVWFDSLNIVKGDSARNLMPFMNSLACKSMALTSTYCTGARTVEGLASIIGGVPTFGPINWMATKYAPLPVDAPARLLASRGFDTRFFIGAKANSFSLGPLARTMGFAGVTSMAEVDLPASGNSNSWGIYDHVMGRYVAGQLSAMSQPFFAAWLTLDLHSPFDIPDNWDDSDYRPVSDPMERCVEYTDFSLKMFFEEASRQPWFDNTLFVITADHGFRDFITEPKYNGAYIYGHIPFLLYTPDGSLPAGKHAGRPMAQFDIPPTLLWLAGYDEPYVSVGTNWFDDAKPHYGVVMRNDMWYVISERRAMRLPFDASRVDAVFDVINDQELLSPLTDYDADEIDGMLTWFRAFLQDYTSRANGAALSLGK